ncbi:MAG TPA: magnesium transporter [Candidatus Absconditabacterales bacterium]|nr:magnesium transporter [Candidatus Absconditabacterales bacterium]
MAGRIPHYADDDYESIGTLLRLRAPALVLGLVLGIGISFVTSRFEEVLSHNVQVAFFLPFIVYIADAIGTQTETIYSRDLKTGQAKLSNYLRKEFALGIIFGALFGVSSGLIVLFWLKNTLLALSVSLSSFLAIATAPLIALAVVHIFQSIHKDPAASSGPIATVIQDMLSVLIYGAVTSLFVLHR